MSPHDFPKRRGGGRLLVECLVAQGVEHVFCVPGESYLPVLDALHDAPIRVTTCRQEGGAVMMADAAARLTGRPGIAMVSRGPGAMNAAAGIHIAEHDSVPLVLFVGQVERSMRGRGAFQEVDYEAVFGPLTKLAVEIGSADRIPEIVSRAFHVAMQGRPGPVVVSLPEDMLAEVATATAGPRVIPADIWPGASQMCRLHELLDASSRPLLVLGGGGWNQRACDAMRGFAERFALPVVTTARRASLFDGDHPCYAGELGLAADSAMLDLVRGSDLVILAGTRMSENPSQGYSLFEIPAPRQTLVHVHADPAELGRVYRPELGIVATPEAFAEALALLPAPASISWPERTRQARAAFLSRTEPPASNPGLFQFAPVMKWLRTRLPDDAIVTNGAGTYTIWPNRYLRYRRFGTQLGPASGSMGYGLPAAVGAKRLHPERLVVCFAGDGCFLMNGQEFATAALHGLAIVAIVLDNGIYGTIRMYQENTYPGRITATDLHSPDFAAHARAFGGHGETVRTAEEFALAFERAIDSGKPSILHVLVDPEAITPTATLSGLREQALRRGAAAEPR